MLGDNLKKYRCEKGYSQKELAELLFVTRQCVSKWEKNATEPDLQTLARMSDVLGVSVDALVKDDGGERANGEAHKKTDRNRFLFILNMIVAATCVLGFVALWRYLPNIIPAHFTHGEIDRYGSRDEIFINLATVDVFAVVSLAMFFILRRVSRAPKYRAMPEKSIIVAARVCHILTMAFQAANLIVMVALYAEYITAVMPFATCVCADIILGAAVAGHPKITGRNGLLGVRTADTLASDEVWKRSNALACYMLSILSAAIFCVNAAVEIKLAPLFLTVYFVPAVAVIVYAKAIARKSGGGSQR